MVRRNVTAKNLLRTIKGSLGRYLAIFGIIALGSAMFVGLLTTKGDMIATGQDYMDRQNMFDLKLYSSYGWTQAEVDKIRDLPGVTAAEGMMSMDVIGARGGGKEAVYKLHSISETVDRVFLLGGRMPEASNECLVDGFHADESILGTTFTVSGENAPDTLESLAHTTYTVVGFVSTPLYMDMSRGTSSLGNGNVESYVYLPREAFSSEIYTDISVTMAGDRKVYTAAYEQAAADFQEQLRPHVTVLAHDRFAAIKAEAQKPWAEGMAEYAAREMEYLSEKEKALHALAEALGEIREAEGALEANRTVLEAGKADWESGEAQLSQLLSQLEAGFAQGLLPESEYLSRKQQLLAQQTVLEQTRVQLEAGFAALAAGERDLADAKSAYDGALQEAEAGFKEAEKALQNAKKELDDAKAQIDGLAPAEVFFMDRSTNSGYLALDNNSDIVSGVARVFPAFFLLVAALVCITTMTRMVEEERTQIGTFKALGYGSGAIAKKYLLYAGSAAVTGCGLGVVLGSIIFPLILWDAYGIILNITPELVIVINWPLCLTVVAVYTVVMLLVTWYCCRRSMQEVPAELIRPKAPTFGKKIWLEYLPFWKKMGFLNKVMLRNVFRYRQRMFMMLVGIGGCTALLLTGFGLRDSIVNIAANQFENITPYDINVYFSEAQGQESQDAFRDTFGDKLQDHYFYYQTSTELRFGGESRDISLISGYSRVGDYIRLRQGERELGYPEKGQVFLSVGMAELMQISQGDTVTLLDADMRQLTLLVAGIFDNNVYNYAIVHPDTLLEQWGTSPEPQMAFVNVKAGLDIHQVSAELAGLEGVLNLSISQDVEKQIGGMLDALNAVVATVVTCAFALAVIVLYNLTNINITERIREIATLKVLGFCGTESAAYVFKENLLLTAMGTAVGLVGGKFLLDFVISQIQIELVWFRTDLAFLSFALSVVLTMLSAVFVDFLLYFKLEKINMAEALKSIE